MENFRIQIAVLAGREREEKGVVEEVKEWKAETVDGLLLYTIYIYCFSSLSSLQNLHVE